MGASVGFDPVYDGFLEGFLVGENVSPGLVGLLVVGELVGAKVVGANVDGANVGEKVSPFFVGILVGAKVGAPHLHPPLPSAVIHQPSPPNFVPTHLL